MRSFISVVLLSCCFVATAPTAQESVHQGSISGRVVDPDGGVVAGAAITLRQLDTDITTTTKSDSGGRFRMAYLQIGPYELRATTAGFRDAVLRLNVGPGSAFELVLPLEVGDIATSVTVSASGGTLDTARTQVGATVSRTEIQQLPMNGRHFLDLALVVPGVSPANTNSTQLFAETSAIPGQGLSVSSQRNLSNSFIVDGLSANDDAAGLAGMAIGVDAIEQFQVVTGGGQAELGRAIGGYVNVVTRSGTNMLRGSGYAFLRADALNGASPLTGGNAADGPAAVRRQPWRSRGQRPDVLLCQRRAAGAGPDGSRDHCPGSRGDHQRAPRCGGLPWVAPGNGPLSESRAQRGWVGKDRPRPDAIERPRRALRVLSRAVGERARSRQLECRGRVDRPQHCRSLSRRGAHAVTVGPDDPRHAPPGGGERPRGPADRCDRAASHDCGRRDVRAVLEQSDPTSEHDGPGHQQRLAPHGLPCGSCGPRLAAQRHAHHVPQGRSRQLHVLVPGWLPRRHTTTSTPAPARRTITACTSRSSSSQPNGRPFASAIHCRSR